MIPVHTAASKRTDALSSDVTAMEQRLLELKSNMSKEKARRDASRQRNPSGAIWGSARTDVPTDSRYVKEVLRQPNMAATRQLAPTPPHAGGPGAAPPRRRQTPPQKADGGTSMSEDMASRPIIEPGGLLAGAGAGGAFSQQQQKQQQQQQPAAAAAIAAAKSFDGFGGGLGGGTRSCFEFNLSTSQSFLSGDDHDYEDLLGPVDPDPSPAQPQPHTQRRQQQQQQAPSGGGGGSLLDGNFDEDESASSFQDALRAFRGEPPAPPPARRAASTHANAGGSSRTSSLPPVAESGGSGGGSLLQGNFDEDESAASFQDALRAFRGEAPAPAKRSSRFVVQQQPPPAAAASASAEPTMADKVHALKEELGLPMDMSMVNAIRQANGVVGLQSIGTLAEQLGRLLRECGVKAKRGQAGGADGADGGGSASASSGAKASSGTSTTVDVGDPVSARGSGSRPSSAGGTQTAPPKSFYERFLEQKKKDGVR